MHMTDLIEKKKQGQTLTQEELHFIVHGYTAGDIPDYQMSALMMAIYFRGMTPEETAQLTIEMEHSGDVVDLSPLGEHTADKHSTGGVGDKTSLVLCPMVAACGGKMAKMSGRGLGHTGGTIDKLESFPGFSTAMTPEKFLENAENVGFLIAGQTANLAPADKKMYALRDVTATVDSIPLIVSSIMAKKLASGARTIVLDVKTGSGAFMETEESAFELARQMVSVGKHAGRNMAAVVTDMDQPLGFAVGNALEVKEAISVLRGADVPDLRELCLVLGTNILVRSGLAETEEEAPRGWKSPSRAARRLTSSRPWSARRAATPPPYTIRPCCRRPRSCARSRPRATATSPRWKRRTSALSPCISAAAALRRRT